MQLRLPLTEVLLLRQLIGARAAVEALSESVGPLVEEASVEIPQRAVGGVVETSAVDRHRTSRRRSRRASSVRRCASARRVSAPRIVSASVASRPMPALPVSVRNVEHVEAPPRAGDDSGQPARIATRRRARLRDVSRAPLSRSSMCRAAASLGIRGLDRRAKARIDEVESARGVAGPGRRRKGFKPAYSAKRLCCAGLRGATKGRRDRV